MKKLFHKVTFLAIALLIFNFYFSNNVFAENVDNGISMSPMYEKITLKPGETYSGFFTIASSANASNNFNYEVFTQAYYRDEENNVIFQDVDSRSLISNWTTIDSPTTGTLGINGAEKIYFTIHVPADAPAGGQYEAITVKTLRSEDDENNSMIAIQESLAIGYTIYAEIEGNTVHSGEIFDINVPSLLLSGNISATSSVKNTGNVHGDAVYKLQVFPLFSNEEVYTNEENPDTKIVLPDRTLVYNTVWEETPDIGIFKVKYTVEFEGETQIVENIVIKCPLWLLFVIIFAVILLILWIIAKSKSHKKSTK